MLAKALYITKDITFVAEQRGMSFPVTPDTASVTLPGGDLAILLDRLAQTAHRYGLHEMSVYLEDEFGQQLGFPARLPTSASASEKHPTVLRAREHGWRVNRLRRWMTFQRENTPTIHIGLARFMNRDANPLWDNDPAAAAYLLWRFQMLCGHAYHAKPGVMGSIMLVSLYRDNQITWHPSTYDVFNQVTITEYNHVNRELVDQVDAAGYVHAYDTNRAYLAAAGAADLARTQLTHTGRTQAFHKSISGLWKVVVPTWNETRLPHPLGSNRQVGDEVWVTTPTLALVAELADDKRGIITMPHVIDAYTAPPRVRDGKTVPHTTRVLREWAKLIDTCIGRCAAEDSSLERDRLVDTFKACYKESVNGIWKTSSSQIFRVDWYYTVGALAGANGYRKVWNTGNTTDRWPTYLGNVDAIHYNSTKPDPYEDRLKRFVIGDGLGAFSVQSHAADEWHQEYGL